MVSNENHKWFIDKRLRLLYRVCRHNNTGVGWNQPEAHRTYAGALESI
jgi:hypothetical protein